MAGIAGIQGNDNGTLERMIEIIKYRGPDETWTSQENGVNIGCLELNMGANCPDGSHHASDGKVSVVLDGRVYNADKGNKTDAEAILDFYNRFGTRFAAKINGDFAVAVSDNGKMILARDWAGIKPLYFGGAVIFIWIKYGKSCILI